MGLLRIVVGIEFELCHMSGYLFVEQLSDSRIRSSAQVLFMVMTHGVGAVFGSLTSGFLIEHFFTAAEGSKDWHGIWVTFALYALAMAIVFVPLFKHKHDPDTVRRAQQRAEGELVP